VLLSVYVHEYVHLDFKLNWTSICYGRPTALYCAKGGATARMARYCAYSAREALLGARSAYMVLSAFEYHALPGPR
jgi:hypothetical protein